MEDKKLVKKIKSGDTEALNELILKYYNDIYSYCYRRLCNKENAQDITQDVFLSFCRNFKNYTERGKCKNYLYVIAHNLCINESRKKTPIPVENIEIGDSYGNNTLENKFETEGSVEAALNQLPEEQKDVILLRFYHDFKLKDIAKIMNSGLSVTKYRLGRGLKILSTLLSKEDWI